VLVVRPAIPVGKVPPLKVGTQECDEIVSQSREISHHRHWFPSTRMRVEAQPKLPGAQRGGSGDGRAVPHADGQVPPRRSDRHVRVIAESVDRPAQDVGVVRRGLRERITRAGGTAPRSCAAHARTRP
jgi:hypothetical protein